jgi:4-amino-4-deoxy-L-arabinose transferase-like glycosyltransferase
LFPLVLAGVDELVGTGSGQTRWEAGRLLEAALGAALVCLICLIAVRLWDPAVALTAGALAAVYPPLILVGSSLLSESLFIPLALAAVLTALVCRDSRHAVRWAALTGLLIGLATLTHGNSILLTAPLAWLVWTGRPRSSWRSLRTPAVLVAVMLATLVPWTVRSSRLFREFVPVTTQGGYALAGVYSGYVAHATDLPALWRTPVQEIHAVLVQHPGLSEAQVSDRLGTLGTDYIKAHPAYPLRIVYWSALRMLDLTGTGFERWNAYFEAYPPNLATLSVYAFWLLGLVAIGGVLALRAGARRAASGARAARRAPIAFWVCPVVILIPSLLLLGNTRYRSPADPFIVMLAAVAVTAAWERIAARRRSQA